MKEKEHVVKKQEMINMKFVFEIGDRDIRTSKVSDYNRLRRMMMAVETMINTVLIEFHVHLREEK